MTKHKAVINRCPLVGQGDIFSLVFKIPAYVILAHCRFFVFLLLCLSAGVKGLFASS